jgi:bacterioferritin-associated ferredoxin
MKMTLNFIFLGVHSMFQGDPTTREAASVLVCHCKAINDRTIRQVVKSGARTCRQVDRACQAGGNCGGCQPLIRAIIANERREAHAASGEISVAAS